ncbi:hypothetical protein [Clostridium sp.]|uniref:hypothetical protein n=1 Tax=Clostridium sp. TaxID=1506 RepID=UPI001A599F77|nr:hypothetical protein [Clostridium sp.]MBK5242508.1 hypothetical protein [Clostridium sp.]
MDKKKVVLINVGGIMLVVIVIAFIFLLSIRSEFAKHLDTKYPELSFKVGVTKIDIIYGNYYANVTCLDDETYFPISKDFKTKNILDSYIQYKSKIQYNTKIKNIFDGSDIQKSIKKATGGSKGIFENNALYEQVNIDLISNTDQIAVAKEVMKILKEKNISVEKVIFMYEIDMHVYELWLTSKDYKLTDKEINDKVMKIK